MDGRDEQDSDASAIAPLKKIFDELDETSRALLLKEAKRLLTRQRQGLYDAGGVPIYVAPGEMVLIEALKAVAGFKDEDST